MEEGQINQKLLEALERDEMTTVFRLIETLKAYVGTRSDYNLNHYLSNLPQAIFEARMKLKVSADEKRRMLEIRKGK